MFDAPRFAYSQGQAAYIRLLELVDHLQPDPNQILELDGSPSDDVFADRLAAYWRARNKFLHAGVGIRQTANVLEMLEQIQQPLLAVLNESPDFQPAYRPLIRMAKSLQASDPESAEQLFLELKAIQSRRTDVQTITGRSSNRN